MNSQTILVDILNLFKNALVFHFTLDKNKNSIEIHQTLSAMTISKQEAISGSVKRKT